MFRKKLIYSILAQLAFASIAFASSTEKLKIAVIDTGVDVLHVDLQQNMWVNKKEIPGNGIDDDANGYVDDIHGWNFADENADLQDVTGHGTHINGIISRFNDENLDRSKYEIINIKYYRPGLSLKQQQANLEKSLQYAMAIGVDLINISAGGHAFSIKEYDLLKAASDRGVIIVAASGNKKATEKNSNFYPSAYKLSNLFSVAATDASGRLLQTSNINPHKNNVLIKGERLYSTAPGNRYTYKTGTSQAAALYSAHLIAQRLSKKTQLAMFVSNN